uniref:Fructose-1-6-bisphosphatase class 1 C-terminal domain-containing protein n=1 Tax=Ditylenchus dipsaci TaxID=166011 RepID=A0A915DUS2_9BILA
MLAVRESPLSWATLRMLILFGARIRQKNTRGICPLDLAPEIDKLQETCVDNMFQAPCAPPVTAASLSVPVANEDSLSGSQPSTHEKVVRTAALIHPSKHSKKVHADAESLLFLPSNFGSLIESNSIIKKSKAPLSPRNSTAPSISTVSMLDSLSVKEKDARRKSFVSLQLHRRTKTPKESPLFDNVSWDQAWEMLQKMACNPECIELITRFILEYSSQLDDSVLSEKDAINIDIGRCNASNYFDCYCHSKKFPEEGKAAYGQRYIGSMVAPVHCTTLHRGIFMYPATSDTPNGKA